MSSEVLDSAPPLVSTSRLPDTRSPSLDHGHAVSDTPDQHGQVANTINDLNRRPPTFEIHPVAITEHDALGVVFLSLRDQDGSQSDQE